VNISGTTPDIQKSERNVIECNSSLIPGKKYDELWSTNNKVLLANMDFSGRLHFGL